MLSKKGYVLLNYTDLCPVLHISLSLHQQVDHFMSSLEAGQSEGSVPIRLNLNKRRTGVSEGWEEGEEEGGEERRGRREGEEGGREG